MLALLTVMLRTVNLISVQCTIAASLSSKLTVGCQPTSQSYPR